MPLPAESERAAAEVAAILARWDDALAVYVAGGGRPPSIPAVIAQIRPLVRTSVEAAFHDIADEQARGDVTEAVSVQLAAIQAALRAAERDARRRRRSVPRRLPEPDSDESVAAFARRVGAVVAFAALVDQMTRRRRRVDVRRIARQTAALLPRPIAGRARMIVRTETAIARNLHAVRIADRDDLVIRVLDARRGPTDEACEDVNGRYATPRWLARHPVEHPNCTRLGRPVRLPPGESVTLLE